MLTIRIEIQEGKKHGPCDLESIMCCESFMVKKQYMLLRSFNSLDKIYE